MITVIYGEKGSGKTQRIMDGANAAAEKATGQVVYITDNTQSLGLAHNIRFINVAEYGVRNTYELSGFIKGMLATNFDIQA
ncbi:MAG: twitching motility protein PilT, partial [Clostridiales bacterium]|nr:twitching motility protein PilT [Clostridiales bacterium]